MSRGSYNVSKIESMLLDDDFDSIAKKVMNGSKRGKRRHVYFDGNKSFAVTSPDAARALVMDRSPKFHLIGVYNSKSLTEQDVIDDLLFCLENRDEICKAALPS